MKKLKVWLLTLVSVMAIVCCLAACGSSSKAGTYKIASMTIAGTEYKVGDEIPVLGKLADDYVTITLNEDGTCEMVAKMVGTEIKTEGTWKENADDSNKIDMTVEGSTQTLACDGSTISMEMSGNSVVLKK